MKVMYVGQKARKEDNVANTGTVWLGHGDVQEVPDIAWAKLSKHPDVWVLADATVVDTKPEQKDPPPSVYLLQHADGSTLDLGTLDDKALKKFVKEHGLPVAPDLKGDAARAAIMEAVKAATEKA
jgi:hypothetical protein